MAMPGHSPSMGPRARRAPTVVRSPSRMQNLSAQRVALSSDPFLCAMPRHNPLHLSTLLGADSSRLSRIPGFLSASSDVQPSSPTDAPALSTIFTKCLTYPPPATTQSNALPPPHRRPGSSMSISSMLGTAEPSAPQDQFHHHGQHSRNNSRQASIPLAVMSPPQHHSKMPTGGEYSYKPRSETPDRVAITSPGGARAHRSNSGSMTQRPGPFYDPPPRSTPNPQSLNHFPESRYTPPFGPTTIQREENDGRVRRTSISGLLQRPESQPQLNTGAAGFSSNSGPPLRPDSIPHLSLKLIDLCNSPTTVLKCIDPMALLDPTIPVLLACRPFLDCQLQVLRPKVFLLRRNDLFPGRSHPKFEDRN